MPQAPLTGDLGGPEIMPQALLTGDRGGPEVKDEVKDAPYGEREKRCMRDLHQP
jgi:hypothetical protein